MYLAVVLVAAVEPTVAREAVVPECLEPASPSTTVQVPPEPWATTIDVKSAEAGRAADPEEESPL